jgi:hypothetical protein
MQVSNQGWIYQQFLKNDALVSFGSSTSTITNGTPLKEATCIGEQLDQNLLWHPISLPLDHK